MEFLLNQKFNIKEYNLVMQYLKLYTIICDKCEHTKFYAPHHGLSSKEGIYLIECMKCNTRMTRGVLKHVVKEYELPDFNVDFIRSESPNINPGLEKAESTLSDPVAAEYKSVLADAIMQIDKDVVPTVKLAKAFKTDKGKVKAGVLGEFKKALMEVAKVGTMGIEFKGYARGSWRDVPDARERYYDAFWRHILAEEEDINTEDDNVYHIAQVIWNGLALLEFMLEDKNAKGIQSSVD